MARYSPDNTIERCPRTYIKPGGSFDKLACDPELCPHAASAQAIAQSIRNGATRRPIAEANSDPEAFPECYQRQRN